MYNLTLGRAECGHYDCATQKEWLVTNGLGGYAAGTIGAAVAAHAAVSAIKRAAAGKAAVGADEKSQA